jgi:F5/8 type C domain
MLRSAIFGICLSTLMVSNAINIPTSKYDNGRGGLNLSETTLTLQNVNSNTFGKLFERSASGDMYPQPLIVEGLSIGGGNHNVVFVATANNNVYAYDAEDATRTTPYWSVNLGTPVPATDVDCCCTDIASAVGVIGTPAIDTASRTMYLVAKNKNVDGTYHQWLHALDLTTGAEKFGGPKEITATYPGTGAGSVNGVLTFDAKLQNQRAGLLLQAGKVFITWASHNDCGNYHGWVIAYDAATLNQVSVWMTTPSGAQAGNWMSGGGLVGDWTHVYFTTGNGDSDIGSGGNNYGECFVGLNNDLSVNTWYRSGFYRSLNTGDKDLGGCGVQLIPGTRLLVSGGKDGKIYLVDADNMGGFGGDRVEAAKQVFVGSSGNHYHSGPVTFTGPAGSLTYLCAEGDFLKAYKLVNGLYQTTPYWVGFDAPPGMPGAQSSVSANGTANGIVWSTIPYSADANHATVAGILRASDATTGVEIYNSYQNLARDDYGNFAKNPAPVVNNGRVYVPTFSGKLVVYGLVDTNNPPPPPPTPLSQGKPVTASSAQHGNPSSAGNDGSLSTRWSANNGSYPQWWRVDLGASHSLTNVAINWYLSSSRYYQYRIETSADDANYTTVVDKTANTTLGDTSDNLVATARYVRITMTAASSSGWASFWECKVYGN